jgi:two-component system chemotaxis sensor kinase CheA
VLKSDRGSTGLVVDRIHGQREVVVRALNDPLVRVPVVAGATELGDGRPVLILDAAALTSGTVRPGNGERSGDDKPEALTITT